MPALPVEPQPEGDRSAEGPRRDQRERLRLSTGSAVLAVAMLGGTLIVLRLAAASARVLGWIVAAAVVAAFLHPIVSALARRIPRPLALLAVVLASLAAVSIVAFGVVNDLTDELRELRRDAPRAARTIERSERFGEAAREFQLAERTTEFVDELPRRLRGGTVQDAVRSAATRAVAFLASGVLTIFFLIHGPRLLAAGAAQVRDPVRRRRLETVAVNGYRRAWHYVGGSLSMSLLAGVLAWGIAVVLELPGAALLGLWMAAWDVVPLLGAVVGALPLILLAAAESPTEAAVVAVVVLGYQLFESFRLQRWVEARSVHIGPFVTVAVGMVGLEMYGFGGAVVSLAFAVLAAAVADEIAPLGDDDDRIVPGRHHPAARLRARAEARRRRADLAAE